MKRTGVNFCLVFGMILALSAGAAVAQIADPGARKFDEFGDIQASDLIARLDNLAIQLQSVPNNKAYLVVYRTRRDLPGLSNRYAQRMKGYLTNDAVVVATESRTSSPVRIPRDAVRLTHPQIKNLYPCGEGAGYAGGIVSAAMDGERIAVVIAKKYYTN